MTILADEIPLQIPHRRKHLIRPKQRISEIGPVALALIHEDLMHVPQDVICAL